MYNEDQDVDVVPLHWVLQQPALNLRSLHQPSKDPDLTWAHSIELDDPTPFLRGRELVLTTGLRLPRSAVGMRAYVERLASAGASALGFGVGLRHPVVPPGIVRACIEADLALVVVPLPTPFAAVAQSVADHLGEQRRRRLTLTMEHQHDLTRAATGGGVVAVARTLARELDAEVVVCDETLVVLARAGMHHQAERRLIDAVRGGVRGALAETTPHGSLILQPIGEHPVGRVGWLAVARATQVTVTERLVLHHALAVILLILDGKRSDEVDLEAEVVRLLLADGHADDRGDQGDFPFSPTDLVRVMLLQGSVDALRQSVARIRRSHAGSVRAHADPPGATARLIVRDCAVESVVTSARQGPSQLVVAVGTCVPTHDAASSWRTARIAAERLANPGAGGTPGVVWADREPLCILLSDPGVAATVAAVAGPSLSRLDGSLVSSLDSYLSHHGSWGAAAAELGIHRHTMRHRMEQVEQVTGWRLDDAQNRLLLHLALLTTPPDGVNRAQNFRPSAKPPNR